jgi:hypothetical protein
MFYFSGVIMELGQKLVILGALLGATLLSVCLYTLAGAFLYDASIDVANSPESPGEISVQKPPAEQLLSPSANCEVSGRFPQDVLRWCELITLHAYQNSLSPDLVAAVVWQESGGSPVAYSRSGAVGLMQVMPRDGLAASFMCKNGPCFHDRPSIEQLKDPEFNIAYGTKLLSRLVSRNGNLRDGLKSYGPMNVGYYYADKILGLYQKYGN